MKNEILTEICAVLAFSAINNNDKVGVLFFRMISKNLFRQERETAYFKDYQGADKF